MINQSIRNGMIEAIGNTPLIRLNYLSNVTKCEIYGKAEFLNPGGSVKDRAALGIIREAEKEGKLKPGGTIVEGTAGNTGIGLTLVGQALGYKSIIVINNTQAREKIDLLKAMGAQVVEVEPAPWPEEGNYNMVAKKIAENLPNGFWANQFDNQANALFHYKTTGPEIWEQTQGKITSFVAAVGTGGTIAGVSKFLKEKNAKVRTVVADPYGAAIYSWIKYGHFNDDEGDSITEGIGMNRLTKNLELAKIDDAYRIHDKQIIEMLYLLLKKEGLFLGSSSAINVCGAVKEALKNGPGQTIVTILCDGGQRYISKIYNQDWLKEQNLLPSATDIEFFKDI
jgi:cysteine synthase A